MQTGPDPDIAPARDDDEALQQGAQPRRVHGLEQDVGRGVGLDHQRVRVHQGRDRTAGIEGAAELGGHLQGEGVALDQADGPPVRVRHGDDQGVGLGLKAVEGLRAKGLRRHGRRRLDEVSDPGHVVALPAFCESAVRRAALNSRFAESECFTRAI
ncbi:hypothetical protein D3C72_1969860 [compost metagenome]